MGMSSMAEARPRKLVCITWLASLATVVATLGAPVVARADGSATNLDDNLSGWRIWWDCGGCAGSGQINPDPGEDGSGMDIDFQGGPSYVGMYNYYPLPADPSANGPRSRGGHGQLPPVDGSGCHSSAIILDSKALGKDRVGRCPLF